MEEPVVVEGVAGGLAAVAVVALVLADLGLPANRLPGVPPTAAAAGLAGPGRLFVRVTTSVSWRGFVMSASGVARFAGFGSLWSLSSAFGTFSVRFFVFAFGSRRFGR